MEKVKCNRCGKEMKIPADRQYEHICNSCKHYEDLLEWEMLGII